MALKPTMRKAGTKHVTVRIAFHASAEDAAYFLASKAESEDLNLDGNVTKAYVETAMREAFNHHGQDASMAIGDQLNDSERGEEYITWAEAQIARLYPDWKED